MADKVPVSILLKFGRHSVKCPDTELKKQLASILELSGYEGEWRVTVEQMMKATSHTRGVRLSKKEIPHGNRLVCQPGNNSTRFSCCVITKNGYSTKEVRENLVQTLEAMQDEATLRKLMEVRGMLPEAATEELTVTPIPTQEQEMGTPTLSVVKSQPSGSVEAEDSDTGIPENLQGFLDSEDNLKKVIQEIFTEVKKGSDQNGSMPAHVVSLLIRMATGLTETRDWKDEQRQSKMAGALRRRLTEEDWLEVTKRGVKAKPLRLRLSQKAYALIGETMPSLQDDTPQVEMLQQPTIEPSAEPIIAPPPPTLRDYIKSLKEKAALGKQARERLDFMRRQKEAAQNDVRLFHVQLQEMQERLEEANERVKKITEDCDRYEAALHDPSVQAAERELEELLAELKA